MKEELGKKRQLTRYIGFRTTEETYRKLSALIPKTREVRNLSQLVRRILEEGKFTIETYDSSEDKLMEELAGIRRELHAIGVNINQVTRRFHSEKSPEARLASVLEITRLFQQADLRLTEVFTLMSKIAGGWLPK